jgi:hypothetical protein
MIGLLQATSVFVSTITITAIALDRRRLIVGSEQVSISQTFLRLKFQKRKTIFILNWEQLSFKGHSCLKFVLAFQHKGYK